MGCASQEFKYGVEYQRLSMYQVETFLSDQVAVQRYLSKTVLKHNHCKDLIGCLHALKVGAGETAANPFGFQLRQSAVKCARLVRIPMSISLLAGRHIAVSASEQERWNAILGSGTAYLRSVVEIRGSLSPRNRAVLRG